MSDLSQRLREPFAVTILIIAIAGWLAFFALWINSAGTADSQRTTIETLTSERDDVARRLVAHETADGDLAALGAEIAKAQQDLAANTASLETVRTELAARQTDLETTNTTLDATRTEAITLEQTAQTARQQAAALTAQQQDLQGQIDTGTQQLNDIGTRLAEARALEATATANSAQLTAEAATATGSLADLQAQLQTTREQLTTSQSQLADLAIQSETAGSDFQAVQQQLAELQARRDQLSGEVNSYQSQRDTLQPQVDQLTRTLADRSNDLAALERRIAEGVAANDAAARTGRFVVSTLGAAQGMTLTLGSDGAFELRNRIGREVTGRFELSATELVLTNATGNLGNATFPMTCSITPVDTGLTIGEGEGCALAGLEFIRSP